MSCNDKIKQRCKKVPAGCVNFEAQVPEFSSLVEDECLSIEEVALDIYDIIGGIKQELALEEITSDCIELPTIIDTKILFQLMMDKICQQQEQINTLIQTQQDQTTAIEDLQNSNCP